MENFGKKHCRCTLCFCLGSDEHFEEIDDVTRAILNLLRLNFDNRAKQIMCNACSRKAKEASIFKSMCLSNDNIVISYTDVERGGTFDFREVYGKKKEVKQLNDTLDGHKVCRFCLQLISEEFMSIHELEIDMIEKYIPEINFSVVEDPVICRQCFESFDTHSNFIKNCLEIEEKIKHCHNMEASARLYSCIKVEEIDIKSEVTQQEELLEIYPTVTKIEDNETSNKTEYMEIKEESEDRESDMPFYKSDVDCINEYNEDVKTTKNNMHEHKEEQGIAKQKNKLEMHMYSCDLCDFSTKYRSSLKRHAVTHSSLCIDPEPKTDKDSAEMGIYKCYTCDYKTVYRRNLVTHQLIHRHASEVQLYTCDTCDFKSRHRTSLRYHQIRHKDYTETLVFKCDVCNYKSKRKGNLVIHQLSHKNPSEVPVYKCDLCDYETKYSSNLVIHQVKHKNSSEVQLYTCDKCRFTSKYLASLRSHQVKHKDPSKVQMYECDTCGFTSKYRANLRVHQLIHRDPAEVQMHKCDSCDYETKYKNSLVKHVRKHKNFLKLKLC